MKDEPERYKLFDPGSKKRRVNLSITEIALLKMIGLIESFKGEVGWHGTAVRNKKTSFTIEDIFVYPQDATPASVDTDQSGYEKWLYTLPNEVFGKMRMHGHSHYNFGVTPSSKDEKHRNGLVGQLVDDMFYIFMIWNKEYKFNVLLYDHETGILYNTGGIDVFVLSGDESTPLTKVSLKDLKAKLVGDEAIKAFLSEAKRVVNIREDKSIDTRLIHNNDLYSMLFNYAGQDIRLLKEATDEENSILKFIAENGSEILRLVRDNESISIVWNIGEVRSVRPDLTDDECMAVLGNVLEKYDTSIGVTWDTIKIRADELFPKPNDAKMYGKFVRNEIAKLIAVNSGRKKDCVFENSMILTRHEVKSKVILYQDVDAKRLYHHWYGGCIANIEASMNGKEVSAAIVANGDIRVYLYDKENNALCNIKDRSNNAGFCELSRYIPDDGLLAELIEHNENEQGFSLQIEDSNWWELYPDFDTSSVALSDYSLADAIGEAAEIFYKHLERKENANEPE